MTTLQHTDTRKNWRGLFTDAFGLLFAGFWTARGAQAAHLSPVPTAGIIAIPTLILLAGFTYRDIILRHPELPADKELLRRAKIMRIVLIAAASWWANATHHIAMFLPLLGIIIGLSYIMIARALNEAVHLWMGAAIVAISALSLLLPDPLHLEVAGFGTALCVWLGCGARLWRSGVVPAMISGTARTT